MEENNIHKTTPLLDENILIHKGQPKKTRGKRMDRKSWVSTRTRTKCCCIKYKQRGRHKENGEVNDEGHPAAVSNTRAAAQ